MLSPTLIILIPLLPLLSFAIIALGGKKAFPGLCGVLATLAMLGSFLLSLTLAYEYFFSFGKMGAAFKPVVPFAINWLPFTPALSIDMGVLLDPISMMMIIVVTMISLMVHFYSLGYMKGEERYATYFSFLGLFTFSMLGLVLSSNIFQIYVFWELVGVSSFLLIGFYYDRPSAVAASKKAFIVTRLLSWVALHCLGGLGWFSLAARASQPCFRCTFGCPTRWKVLRLYQHSYMQLLW